MLGKFLGDQRIISNM